MSKTNRGGQTAGVLRPEKESLSDNGTIDMQALRLRDHGKVPLQINRTLTILVQPQNCTQQYAEQYRHRMESNVIHF